VVAEGLPGAEQPERPHRFVRVHVLRLHEPARLSALQLRFSLQVSALCGGLVSSSPR
jgi:hypothetical protein